jgi:hypothetical protein
VTNLSVSDHESHETTDGSDETHFVIIRIFKGRTKPTKHRVLWPRALRATIHSGGPGF